MATLNALKKAPVLNEAGIQLKNSTGTVTTSDASVVSAVSDGSGSWWAVGIGGGSAVLTASRHLDGATATLPVTVVAAVPFAIALGAEVPA
jgi:hypothetical protein